MWSLVGVVLGEGLSWGCSPCGKLLSLGGVHPPEPVTSQEGIPVGCIPPACTDRTCFFNSHQMAGLVGGGGGSSEQV